MSQQKPRQRRDDVLRRMLKTPPALHKPIGKRKKADDDALIEQIKNNPDKLDEMARLKIKAANHG